MLLTRVVRTTAFGITFFLSLTVLCATSPLLLLNPVLRRLGVPTRHFPSCIIQRSCVRAILFSGGVVVRFTKDSSEESRNILSEGPFIIMYTHASNLDPLVVLSLCPNVPKFIYKKELGYVPLFGWAAFLYRHISIDRKDRAKAISSLDAAVRTVVNTKQSVAIAPEGTRSRTGELGPFKRGPFHMAVQSGAVIVPLVIRGANSILPPKAKLLHVGVVEVTLLPPIRSADVDDAQAKTEAAVVARVTEAKALEARAPATKKASLAREIVATLPGLVVYAVVSALYYRHRLRSG